MNIHRIASWLRRAKTLRNAGLCLGLGLGLSACGGSQFMASKEPSDDVATIRPAEAVDTPDAPESVSPAAQGPSALALTGTVQAAQALALTATALAAHSPGLGSTRSGEGMLDRVVVRRGDTLWKIAQRADVYGAGGLYPLIYKANRKRIPHPNRLMVGAVLRVPRNVPDPELEKAEEEAMTGQFLDASPLPVAALAPPRAAARPAFAPAPAQQAQAAAPAPKGFGLAGMVALGLCLAAGAIFAFVRLSDDDPENGA